MNIKNVSAIASGIVFGLFASYAEKADINFGWSLALFAITLIIFADFWEHLRYLGTHFSVLGSAVTEEGKKIRNGALIRAFLYFIGAGFGMFTYVFATKI
jgi:hypothetical protein